MRLLAAVGGASLVFLGVGTWLYRGIPLRHWRHITKTPDLDATLPWVIGAWVASVIAIYLLLLLFRRPSR